MTEISYINIQAASDTALIRTLGAFIKHHRVQQNKSQAQLAKEAGIVRSTLSLFENGENTSLMVFIQLLRALKLLHLLQQFEIEEELSPLQLAKLEYSPKKTRARRKNTESKNPEPKSDW
jgi:transcriptional regulator with XRE-family HTH domain